MARDLLILFDFFAGPVVVQLVDVRLQTDLPKQQQGSNLARVAVGVLEFQAEAVLFEQRQVLGRCLTEGKGPVPINQAPSRECPFKRLADQLEVHAALGAQKSFYMHVYLRKGFALRHLEAVPGNHRPWSPQTSTHQMT
eukprot:scaffold5342_cov344-Prasinococcus_capsulatus_cf.AAC.1